MSLDPVPLMLTGKILHKVGAVLAEAKKKKIPKFLSCVAGVHYRFWSVDLRVLGYVSMYVVLAAATGRQQAVENCSHVLFRIISI